MSRAVLPLLAAAVALAGCTRAGLEEIPAKEQVWDDKLEISGSLCTLEPESLTYPVRVMFVVDASDSMSVNDPPDPVTGVTGRERAVREAWMALLEDESDDVAVSILRFSGYAQSKTATDLDDDGLPDTWFTSEPTKLDVATSGLAVTDGTTDFINALNEARFELRTEMELTELESLPLSKYVVIFLSDGLPDLDGNPGKTTSTGNILAAVQSIMDVAELFQVGDFTFHTAYLSSGKGPAVDQPAQDLLQAMADVGSGTYRSFPNNEELNFLFVDFGVVHRVFTLQSLAAVNLNSVVDVAQTDAFGDWIMPYGGHLAVGHPNDGSDLCGIPLTDSDGDGLADVGEYLFGSDPLVQDSDGDGLDDRVEWSLNRLAGESGKQFDPGVADSGCIELHVDADGDQLDDCEEIFLGTAGNGVDTDADGLPDLMEVRLGTSAVEADKAGDLDWDDTLNGVEVRTHTDPLCDDLDLRSDLAYRYELYDQGLVGATTCYDFAVGNITLLSTAPNAAAERPGNGWNRVLVFAGEAGFDTSQTFARFRVACVDAMYRWYGDYKMPPSGKVQLSEGDFVPVAEFDPDLHCVAP